MKAYWLLIGPQYCLASVATSWILFIDISSKCLDKSFLSMIINSMVCLSNELTLWKVIVLQEILDGHFPV